MFIPPLNKLKYKNDLLFLGMACTPMYVTQKGEGISASAKQMALQTASIFFKT